MEKKPITRDPLNFFSTGYADYLAARILFNKNENRLIPNALTLASTAIERYLKGILSTEGIQAKFHMSNLGKIAQLFHKMKINIYPKLDPNFLQLLSKVYQLRYWDKINKTEGYGFLLHQFLGELDATIFMIEKVYKIMNANTDKEWLSPYKIATNKKEPDLSANNFLAEGISKKEWMDRDGILYSFFLTENKVPYYTKSTPGAFKQENGYQAKILFQKKIALKYS